MNKSQVIIRKSHSKDAAICSDIAIRSKASWGYSAELIDKWHDELIVTPGMLEAHIAFIAEYDNNTISRI